MDESKVVGSPVMEGLTRRIKQCKAYRKGVSARAMMGPYNHTREEIEAREGEKGDKRRDAVQQCSGVRLAGPFGGFFFFLIRQVPALLAVAVVADRNGKPLCHRLALCSGAGLCACSWISCSLPVDRFGSAPSSLEQSAVLPIMDEDHVHANIGSRSSSRRLLVRSLFLSSRLARSLFLPLSPSPTSSSSSS